MLTLRCRLPLEIQPWKLSTFSGWSKTCLHCNGDQKKFDEKLFFIEISDSKFKVVMGIWRSLNPSSCLLLACNWLKYDYGTFLQSLGVAKHVKIGLKNMNMVILGPKVAEEIFRKNDVTIVLDVMWLWELVRTKASCL